MPHVKLSDNRKTQEYGGEWLKWVAECNKGDFEVVPKRVSFQKSKHTLGLRSQKLTNEMRATRPSGVPEVGVS